MDVTPIIEPLNDAQRAAVTAPDKPQQVLLERLGLNLPRRLRRIDEVARL